MFIPVYNPHHSTFVVIFTSHTFQPPSPTQTLSIPPTASPLLHTPFLLLLHSLLNPLQIYTLHKFTNPKIFFSLTTHPHSRRVRWLQRGELNVGGGGRDKKYLFVTFSYQSLAGAWSKRKSNIGWGTRMEVNSIMQQNEISLKLEKLKARKRNYFEEKS